jgi:hypothetical protein
MEKSSPIASLALMLAAPASILAFSKLQPTRAAVVVALGSILFLPEAGGFKVPGLPPLDKTTIPIICMVVGTLLNARGRLREARVGRGIDLIILAMLAGCVGTMLTNPDPLQYGQVILPGLGPADLWADWMSILFEVAGPFLLGRVLVRTAQDARTLLECIIIGALVYVPFVLIELRFSPQMHQWVYGFAQHSFAQTKRDGGWRPMVFMHHGLALALHMSVAAFSAWALTRRRIMVAGLPPGVIAVSLTVLVALLNSFGALLYTLVGVPIVWFARPKTQLRFAAVLAAIIVLYPASRITGVFPTDKLVDLAATKSQDRAGSLNYRFNTEDIFLERTLQRPVFGWGGWARGHVWDENGRLLSILDGAWLAILQRGFWGLTLEFALLLLPIAMALRRIDRVPVVEQPLLAGCGLASIFYSLDLLPNGMFNWLPLFFSGALAGLAQGMTNPRVNLADLTSVQRDLLARLVAVQSAQHTR